MILVWGKLRASSGKQAVDLQQQGRSPSQISGAIASSERSDIGIDLADIFYPTLLLLKSLAS